VDAAGRAGNETTHAADGAIAIGLDLFGRAPLCLHLQGCFSIALVVDCVVV
jgi:hypothetical protein